MSAAMDEEIKRRSDLGRKGWVITGRRGPIAARLKDVYFKAVRGELKGHTNWLGSSFHRQKLKLCSLF